MDISGNEKDEEGDTGNLGSDDKQKGNEGWSDGEERESREAIEGKGLLVWGERERDRERSREGRRREGGEDERQVKGGEL